MRKKRLAKSASFTNNVIWLLASAVTVFLFVSFFNFQAKRNQVCANTLSCAESLTLKVDNSAVATFNGQKLVPPKIDLAQKEASARVLGESTGGGEKRVYVDLTNQKLTAYEGDKLFMETLISSGKWFPTPPGEYAVWVKLKATRMSGGEGNDYYNLPNVPYVMFFYNSEVGKGRGFSLHGAYWHNNFGHPMSHGCVNMRIIDAQKLYNWISPVTEGNTTYADTDNPGTKVIIYGKAP